MTKDNLKRFIKGWVTGTIFPTLVDDDHMEVAVKRYTAGDFEASHHHKIAKEITIIVSGIVEMNGVSYTSDDIVIIEPGESTDFKCIADAVTVVLKVPGALNDKYVD